MSVAVVSDSAVELVLSQISASSADVCGVRGRKRTAAGIGRTAGEMGRTEAGTEKNL